MNLFIDTPERAAERMERRWQPADPSASGDAPAPETPAGGAGRAGIFAPQGAAGVEGAHAAWDGARAQPSDDFDLDEAQDFEGAGGSAGAFGVESGDAIEGSGIGRHARRGGASCGGGAAGDGAAEGTEAPAHRGRHAARPAAGGGAARGGAAGSRAVHATADGGGAAVGGAARAARRAPESLAGGAHSEAESEPVPLAGEAYREEMAYDRRRARRRRLAGVLRVLAMIVAVPLAVVVVFLASYALTCILNGASPDELAQLMGNLFSSVGGFVQEAFASSR